MKTNSKKQKEVGSKTMMIKSKAYNQIKRYFHPKDELSKLSSQQKLEAIEKIVTETREELWNYKQKRSKKAKVEKLRNEKKMEQVKKDLISQFPDFKDAIENSNGQFEDFMKKVQKVKKGTEIL